MKIEILGGTSPRLYKLVAPLVMSAAVLRQNNNYPYKTSSRHEWLVGLDDDGKTVRGFFPIERREGYSTSTTTMSRPSREEQLQAFIEEAITKYATIGPLVAVVHSRHVPVFLEKGFQPEREWKLYVKMRYGKNEAEKKPYETEVKPKDDESDGKTS